MGVIVGGAKKTHDKRKVLHCDHRGLVNEDNNWNGRVGKYWVCMYYGMPLCLIDVEHSYRKLSAINREKETVDDLQSASKLMQCVFCEAWKENNTYIVT